MFEFSVFTDSFWGLHEEWLTILVSHFHLLHDERKGRERILIQTDSVYIRKFLYFMNACVWTLLHPKIWDIIEISFISSIEDQYLKIHFFSAVVFYSVTISLKDIYPENVPIAIYFKRHRKKHWSDEQEGIQWNSVQIKYLFDQRLSLKNPEGSILRQRFPK